MSIRVDNDIPSIAKRDVLCFEKSVKCLFIPKRWYRLLPFLYCGHRIIELPVQIRRGYHDSVKPVTTSNRDN